MFSTVILDRILPVTFCGLLLFYLTGCGVSNHTVVPPETSRGNLPAMSVSSTGNNKTGIRQQLQSAYTQWKGTPYAMGGSSKTGVDCSAFTKIVFQDFFDIELPRHTTRQLQTGSAVRRQSIRAGDLIFFKTGRKSFHVGISMENGNFLHASASSGVKISSIGDSYWATRYVGARRVL